MERPGILFPAVSFIIAGTALLWIDNRPDLPLFYRGVLFLIGAVFGLIGLIGIIDWIAYYGIKRYSDLRLAAAITPESQILRVLARLNRDQMDFALNHGLIPNAVLVTSNQEPTPFLRVVSGNMIPISWIGEILERSAKKYPDLIPERSFSDGSVDHSNYEDLIDHMVALGMAIPARGNQPPKLIQSPTIVYRRLGLGLLYELENREE